MSKEEIRIKLPRLTCPMCHQKGMAVAVDVSYGQGDSTHNNFVKCFKCGFENKESSSYGNDASTEELSKITNKYYKL